MHTKLKSTITPHPRKTVVLYSGICFSDLIWPQLDSAKLNKVWLYILNRSKALYNLSKLQK